MKVTIIESDKQFTFRIEFNSSLCENIWMCKDCNLLKGRCKKHQKNAKGVQNEN